MATSRAEAMRGRTGGVAATLIDTHEISDALRRAVVPALAVFTAFLLGAILIVLTDVDHLQQIGTDPVAAIGGALAGNLDVDGPESSARPS